MDIKTLIRDPMSGFRLLYGMRVRAGRYDLLQKTFIKQPYYWLAERLRKGTTVIDIGANIGDTTIYLAMSPNVSRVIAYEPVPDTFNEARKNVASSPYGRKISLANRAMSESTTTKRIDSRMIGGGASSFESLPESTDGKVVVSVTLDNVLRRLKSVAIKSSCEGAERYIFKGADLRNVYIMQIEYFHGCLYELSGILKEKGFKVSHKGTRKTGMIYATR